MTYVPAVEPTYDSEGNVDYYHCEDCGKNYADEAGTQEIADVTIPKLTRTIIPGRDIIGRIRNFFEKIRLFFVRLFNRK